MCTPAPGLHVRAPRWRGVRWRAGDARARTNDDGTEAVPPYACIRMYSLLLAATWRCNAQRRAASGARIFRPCEQHVHVLYGRPIACMETVCDGVQKRVLKRSAYDVPPVECPPPDASVAGTGAAVLAAPPSSGDEGDAVTVSAVRGHESGRAGVPGRPTDGDTVSISYTMTLAADGALLDASSAHGMQSVDFSVGEAKVLPGISAAVKSMLVGEESEFIIAPRAAYGDAGRSGIPRDADLRFVVRSHLHPLEDARVPACGSCVGARRVLLAACPADTAQIAEQGERAGRRGAQQGRGRASRVTCGVRCSCQ
ncbi:MAG: FKBP-type peptidyl-prolyl cis-trans isomerase [Methanobacteriota archaeon]|nr:MAG: FKBP-type peptidyl-prolyl cis-trans isomerase [Euryarchaeota archaeon]